VIKFPSMNSIKTELELKTILPEEAQIIGLIPRIELESDARRGRYLRNSILWVLVAIVCLPLIVFVLRFCLRG